MRQKFGRSFVPLTLALALALPGSLVRAADVDELVATGAKRTDAAAASQDRVDKLVEGTREMAAEYKSQLKVVDGLKVYNDLLSRQLAAQGREIDDLEESIDGVAVIERQIVPLMLTMLESVQQFIELDMPFLLAERRGRVERILALLEDPNVTVAEKFREVVEVFEIENEYGRTIEAYTGTLDTGDGAPREVNFLRVGRVALAYQSADETRSGVWDREAGQWQPMDDEAFASAVEFALDVARKRVAPDLLTVPVPAPVEVPR